LCDATWRPEATAVPTAAGAIIRVVPAPELVSPVPVEEAPAWVRAMSATFLGDPDGAQTERRIEVLRRGWDPARTWGVRDRGRWVATLRTEARRLSVPGPGSGTLDVTADALTNVTVAATHRRRGLMRGMLDESLRRARERGDALSILIAAEWPIYGRFGYSPASLSADYVLHRRRVGTARFGDPARVRHVDREEFGELAPAVFARARRERAGQIDRPASWWSRVLGRDGYPPLEDLPHNWLVHEGEDGPDGLVAWKANGQFGLLPPLGEVTVWDLASAGGAAYRDLWAYLAGIDGIDRVALANRPVDEPVRWLLDDARALVMTQNVDFLWLRLLDVRAALAARRYAVPGEIVIEVSDRDAPGSAAGRYRLAAEGERVECEPTGERADLQVEQRALASAYLGGFRLCELALAGGVVERTAGALALADVMLSTPPAPWNATWF
jgi:predicted acetyltransferase